MGLRGPLALWVALALVGCACRANAPESAGRGVELASGAFESVPGEVEPASGGFESVPGEVEPAAGGVESFASASNGIGSVRWPTAPGWHRIATLPEIARRAEAMAASRTERRIAVADERGRRVLLLSDGEAPRTVTLPDEVHASALGWGAEGLQVLDAAASSLLAVRWADGAADPTLLAEPVTDGRLRLETRCDGAWGRLDDLLRPGLDDAAFRGLITPSGRRLRVAMHEAGIHLIASERGGKRSSAFVTSLPLVRDAVLLGVDPAAEGQEAGWLAVWTGDAGDPSRRMHFVRVDVQGRVLQTTPAPAGFAPSAFDLRAAAAGARDLALVVPNSAGAVVWLFVAGPDGERLRVVEVSAP